MHVHAIARPTSSYEHMARSCGTSGGFFGEASFPAAQNIAALTAKPS